MPKYKVKNGIVYDDTDRMVFVLTEFATDEDERQIELGSEAVPAIKEFIEGVNSGKFTPKTTVKKFQTLIDKYS